MMGDGTFLRLLQSDVEHFEIVLTLKFCLGISPLGIEPLLLDFKFLLL